MVEIQKQKRKKNNNKKKQRSRSSCNNNETKVQNRQCVANPFASMLGYFVWCQNVIRHPPNCRQSVCTTKRFETATTKVKHKNDFIFVSEID